MVYRLAAVSFLNTEPLIDWFTTRDAPDVALQRSLPSRLAHLLASGAADVALLPVVELFSGRAAGVIGGSGIAGEGPVATVKLFYRGDLSRLRSILVDRGSRTSVALLRVLLAERFGASPPCREFEPVVGQVPEPDQGHLVIGDRCFGYESALVAGEVDEVISWDLGAAWYELTGLPFVFAVWCASPDLPARIGDTGLAELTTLLQRARDHGLANLALIADRAAASGRMAQAGIADRDALLYYFQKSLRYEIGAREMAGLHRFHQLCIKHGVVPEGPAPVVL